MSARMGTIDRLEDEWAVLQVDGQEQKVPRAKLPAGAREGDVLDLDTFRIDEAQTQRQREELRQLRERAFAGKSGPGGGDVEL